MRTLKKAAVIACAVFAFSAIGVASASAAEFTASAAGSLEGNALNTQEFTTNGGVVKCTKAHTTGTIVGTTATEQHVTVNYSGCTAFGFPVTVSAATYNFTAAGQVHIKNTITINVPLGGCSVTVGPQTVGTVSFANAGANNISQSSAVTGIKYTSSGGICGASGTNGKYSGNNEIHRVGGGTLRFDP